MSCLESIWTLKQLATQGYLEGEVSKVVSVSLER